MIKGKALKRALATTDAIRIAGDVPLIVDKTELITPELAQEMLSKNKNNRPINWKKVEEYARLMVEGKWKLHSQGIIIDAGGNILTGQKRLWAVVYSGVSVYMRVSRGCPKDTAWLIDRGDPQTSQDLATRVTERKHSVTESSLARGLVILGGCKNITRDIIAETIIKKSDLFQMVMKETKGTKKTRDVLMILVAILSLTENKDKISSLVRNLEKFTINLRGALAPATPEKCWGRGVAFSMALEQAKRCVEKEGV